MDRRTRLTGRELAALRLMAAGRGEGAIASALGMKPPAVQRALLEELTKEQEKESGVG